MRHQPAAKASPLEGRSDRHILDEQVIRLGDGLDEGGQFVAHIGEVDAVALAATAST